MTETPQRREPEPEDVARMFPTDAAAPRPQACAQCDGRCTKSAETKHERE
ncbi:MAG: hypothetical protein AAFQ51_04600 [Pseudomonadota bacterium]